MTHHRLPDHFPAIKKILTLSALALTAQASAECTPAGLSRLYEMKTFKPVDVACLPDGPLSMVIGQGAVAYSNKGVYSGRFTYQNVSLNRNCSAQCSASC